MIKFDAKKLLKDHSSRNGDTIKQPVTSLLALLLLTISLPTIAQNLLIVGGALGADNRSIYQALLDARPADKPQIAIIPLASSSPIKSARSFREELIGYGTQADTVRILPLAQVDDKSTTEDESQWRHNAQDNALADSLNNVGAFWFVGGDQMRIVETLKPKPGNSTPVLKAIFQQWQEGAIVGGTSAGAAIMSNLMIAAGDSYTSITQSNAKFYSGTETQEQGKLYLHHGLGFFDQGIIDQHFDRKARLGRLIRTLSEQEQHWGFGVDENTAMLVDVTQLSFRVIGAGNVTVVDARNAKSSESPFQIRSLKLSVLNEGDHWSLREQRLLHTAGKPTIDQEYANEFPHQGAGLALANQRLDQLLGYQLLDNNKATEIRRYNFVEQGPSFVYRFRQIHGSQGYWSASNGAIDRYTIDQVELDLEPVVIKLESLSATTR